MELEKLNFNIRLTIRHSLRILYARRKMTTFFPLTSVTEYQNLSDEQIEHIDQLVYRFQKLQDDMGTKLFKSIVASLGETEVFNKPILEIINIMKKYGIISDKVDWQTMREIRNSLTHEYLDDIKNDIKNDIELLNYLFTTKSLELIQILKEILDYIKRNINISQDTKIEMDKFYAVVTSSNFSNSKS